MIVAISAEGPGLEARCSSIFGRCACFSFVDADTMACESVLNAAASASGGAGVQAAQAVVQRKAFAVISAIVGPNAYDVLGAAGIAVYVGAQGTVREAVVALGEGRLTRTGGHTVADHAGRGVASPDSARAEELARLREQATALRRQLADLLDRIDTLSKGA